MIPLIQQALAVGWSASQILSFLSGKVKNLSPGINNAKKSGYSEEDILKFIQGKIKTGKVEEPNTPYGKYLKSSGVLTPEESKQRKAQGIKSAIGAGGTALAAYGALKNAGPMIQRGMQAIGASPMSPSPTPGPQPIGTTPGVQAAEVTTGAIEEGMKPGAALEPSQGPSIELSDEQRRALPFLEKRGLLDKLSKMSGKGKSKEEMMDFLKKKLPLMDQEYLRTFGVSGEGEGFDQALEKLVEPFFPGDTQVEESIQETVEEAQIETPQGEEVEEEAEAEIQPQEVAKGSRVLTEEGDIAEVLESPGKAAKVSIDGKNKVFDKEGLVPVPQNEEEVEDIYKKLLDKIPEGEKSRMADYIGYNSQDNELQVIFQNGASYIYDDVPEEIVQEIVNSDFMAKTTGGNYIGNWYKGAPSIGAGVSLLIRDLQEKRGGKGKEYSKKFAELYSLHRYPKQKLKEKYEREKKAKKKKKV